MDVLSTTLLIFMGMIFPYSLRKGGKAVEYDARSETRLSIETSPVARTERGASRLKKSKFALMMLTAKRSSLPPHSLSLFPSPSAIPERGGRTIAMFWHPFFTRRSISCCWCWIRSRGEDTDIAEGGRGTDRGHFKWSSLSGMVEQKQRGDEF